MTALSAKNKLEFVLGSHPYPAKNHSTYAAWNRCNNMVVSWLVHFVSVLIGKSIIWMDSAVDVWNDIKTRYSQGNLSRISDLQMEVATFVRETNLSLITLLSSALFGMKLRILDLTRYVLVRQIALVIVLL